MSDEKLVLIQIDTFTLPTGAGSIIGLDADGQVWRYRGDGCGWSKIDMDIVPAEEVQ